MAAERAAWTRREHFAGRVEELLGSGTVSPPYWRGERYFLTRREPGQQFSVLYVVDADGTERVLIDPMALDPTGVTTLDSWQPSKEGDRIAYQLSVGGNEESLLYVMDVDTGETIEGPIDRCRYSPVAWVLGGASFYYVRRIAPELLPESEQNFHRRVYLHRVGASPDTDELVFGAGMTMTNYYGVEVSRDGHWLQVSASEGTEPRNDLWVADLTTSPLESPAFTLVQGDVDAQTGLTFLRDGRVLVSTDLDAPRGRVAVTRPGAWSPDTWTDLDRGGSRGRARVGDGARRHRARRGPPRRRAHLATASRTCRCTARPTAATCATSSCPAPARSAVPSSTSTAARSRGSSSPTTRRSRPSTRTTRAPMTSRCTPVRRARSRCRPCTRGRSRTPRRTAPRCACSCCRPRRSPTAPRPTILYGYGGFGVPLTPGYSAAILAWVEAGGVWAIANLRGGSEEGEDWHRAGMLGQQAERVRRLPRRGRVAHRVRAGHRPTHLGIYGGSNGGLLVGAAMTQRPDLFNAVVCVAPLLDMIRYTTSELGPTWTVEYGDPEDPEQFGWLFDYSPYHRVVEGTDYPATMFAVFDNDTRTDPDARAQDVRGDPARHVGNPSGPAAHRGRRRSRRPLPVEVRGGDGRHARVLRALDGAVVIDRHRGRRQGARGRSGRPARDFLLGVPLQILRDPRRRAHRAGRAHAG